jgi:TM2 domain-containing membrane protein YozV
MRSVGMAYLLWALMLFGLAGIHRFYAGRYVTGFFWLTTWGLFGIGTLIDLCLIPGMIERRNRELAAAGSWQLP